MSTVSSTQEQWLCDASKLAENLTYLEDTVSISLSSAVDRNGVSYDSQRDRDYHPPTGRRYRQSSALARRYPREIAGGLRSYWRTGLRIISSSSHALENPSQSQMNDGEGGSMIGASYIFLPKGGEHGPRDRIEKTISDLSRLNSKGCVRCFNLVVATPYLRP